jgi:thiol-disulfide isomerase/thioredoxin
MKPFAQCTWTSLGLAGLFLVQGFSSTLPAAAKTPGASIEATTLDGMHRQLGVATDTVTLVNFWATWCTPCRAEMPALDAYYQAHRQNGLLIVAISMDDAGKAKLVRSVAASYHFPVALQRDVKLPAAFRPSQLPVTLVFDRSGTLRFDSRRVKPALMDAAALERIVGPIIAEQPKR